MELMMFDDKFKTLTGMTWEEAATHCNQLFFEATRLDEQAYLLLLSEKADQDVWNEFAALKKAAKVKHTAARLEWFRLTRILNSIDPKSGKSTFSGKTTMNAP